MRAAHQLLITSRGLRQSLSLHRLSSLLYHSYHNSITAVSVGQHQTHEIRTDPVATQFKNPLYAKSFSQNHQPPPSKSNNRAPCWSCASSDVAFTDFFCPSCGVVQPPAPQWTHFDLLFPANSSSSSSSDELKFDVDMGTMAASMKSLQSQLHPDKFTLKSEEEQHYAAECSTRINAAYSVLSHPLRRAAYILEVTQGWSLEDDIGKEEQDPDFLLEMMELNEEVEAAMLADDATEIDEIRSRVDGLSSTLLTQLSTLLQVSSTNAKLTEAQGVLQKLKYHESVLQRIREWEHSKL